ncbi:MAG: zinc ribbon domain-containing protein, partial [Chloroflexota bacterium]|nr:zinc ribbon domain-containing protein [Chloroflexota bacterium]
MERLADTDRLDDPPHSVEASPVLRITCPACGRESDHLSYCGHCGTRLPPATPADDLETPDESSNPEAGYVPRAKGARRILPRLTSALRGQDPSRRAVAAGFVLVLIALLADQPGIAIAVAASVAPILTLISLARLDLYEEEPWRILLLIGAVAVLG